MRGSDGIFADHNLFQELRYPLFWIFDAVTFVDVGNVFPRASDFKLSELRTAGGFGLRIRNPFVVLRFDYGFKFNRRPGETRGAFFFSIGQAFLAAVRKSNAPLWVDKEGIAASLSKWLEGLSYRSVARPASLNS